MPDDDKETPSLTAIADREVHEYVMARARRVDFKQGKVMRRIVNYWLAMGAPSLMALDVNYPPPPDRIRKYAREQWAHLSLPKDNHADSAELKKILTQHPNPAPAPRLQSVQKRRRAERPKDSS
jgi:hypothetical protein